MLPNCIINGVAKSGTTAIHRYLSAHPDVFMSEVKQLKYFAYEKGTTLKNEFPVTSLEEYEKHFLGAEQYKVRGESSPVYFHSDIAPARIKDAIPDVKIITCLRNPVDRAYSGYLMHYRSGGASGDIKSEFDLSKHWVKLSFYHENLKRNFSVFGEENLKVILFDDLSSDTKGTMLDIFEFLELSKNVDIDFNVKHNQGFVPKSKLLNYFFTNKKLKKQVRKLLPESGVKMARRFNEKNKASSPKMPDEVKEYLTQLYKEDILRTQDFLKRDLSAWLGAG